MVCISAEYWPLYRPRHLPIVSRCVDHHSADIPVDTSVDMSTDTSLSTYWLTPDQYVNRHIDTSVECQPICRPIYRSRGAQNTHDPIRLRAPVFYVDRDSQRGAAELTISYWKRGRVVQLFKDKFIIWMLCRVALWTEMVEQRINSEV